MLSAIYISLLCFIYLFIYFEKQNMIDLKKSVGQNFCNVILLFLHKIGSVVFVNQQINLVSSNSKTCLRLLCNGYFRSLPIQYPSQSVPILSIYQNFSQKDIIKIALSKKALLQYLVLVYSSSESSE